MKDEIFLTPPLKQFEFDEGVASVFDDMVARSIPFYAQSLGLSVDFVKNCLEKIGQNGGVVYDLGCSTGTFLLELSNRLEKGHQHSLIGIDNSSAMIERAKLKAKTYGKEIDFVCRDFLDFHIDKACAVVANYTIQFVRPINRTSLIDRIFKGIIEGGIFVMSEKMSSPDKVLDREMIQRYYDYKKEQGYTQNEITIKREALENVLVPYSLEENIEILKNAGFKSVEVLFKWINFATIIARKS
ncbi:carboxy-S-adenosyl-L-methionine synthase CmoA [Helicobacter cappadocius]|uniref:Carboxy-S-adenosyl-L-methionine synthase n=1 Tax=Helicobacter cappadocius TaxID=3063998 RepID=A0AA90PIT7_9HELI|nr:MULTISPECIES: carboxy-S-adenosyl-L-methionine synthase CmoA [unclassified Helicobacter]MDO7252968.1 carboxy-S-adenosyl-L-methionine synthase CmoA [Helicobacter sp. faydin-H75]MDP2539042.1 carboxy-S-adenosyl-L-methionine synthase CmoA [Helicobacter sp. faydin-H76]